MNLKLTIFIISCFVTSVISQWRYQDDSDEDGCSFVPSTAINQRISLQKCEEYKNFTYTESIKTGSCNPHKTYNCEFPTGLVSNGLACKENEFPHMAHVGYDESNGVKRYTCGGTLISENFVLTAAHCKSDKGKPPNIVRLNSVSVTEESRQVIYRNIAEIIVHPDYKTSKANDLALLRLSMKVNFKLGKLRPACLWTEDRLEKKNATITGWGALGFANQPSDILMKATLDIVDIGKCKKALGAQTALEEYHICAKDLTEGGRDSCQGDSGGPLQVIQPDNPCMAHVIGVVSRGTACGLRNSIGIYVKVSKFIDWIEENVWKV